MSICHYRDRLLSNELAIYTEIAIELSGWYFAHLALSTWFKLRSRRASSKLKSRLAAAGVPAASQRVIARFSERRPRYSTMTLRGGSAGVWAGKCSAEL